MRIGVKLRQHCCGFLIAAIGAFALFAFLFPQIGKAADLTVPARQIKIGWVTNLSAPGMVFSDPASACKSWPSYETKPPTQVAYNYVFLEVKPGSSPDGMTCLTQMVRADTGEPYLDPFDVGSVEAIYNYICDAPFVRQTATICVLPPDKNLGKSCPSCGNPINPATGNKFQIETDFRGNGPFPLELTRYFNSERSSAYIANSPMVNFGSGATTEVRNKSYALAPFTVEQAQNDRKLATAPGVGWRHNFHRAVVLQSTGPIATVSRADGKIYAFTLIGGVWTPDGDVTGKLVQGGDGAGWTYTTPEDDVESYDANGRLISIRNRAGLKYSFTYGANGMLGAATDSFGRKLTFTYDDGNRLKSLTDPMGHTLTYDYDAIGNLVSVTYPDNKVRTYLYEHPTFPNALTGIVDENGKRYAAWNYDSQGRAISSEHAGGAEKVTVDYASSSTTDSLGATRSYNFQTILNVVKSGGESQPGGSGSVAASTTITYDVNGNVASRTDFNGNKTTYLYDLVRNLETSRTEAVGTPQARTITTAWHPTYRLPVSITEPGKLTTMDYDASGNLLHKTITADGSSRTWSYTYNNLGQVLTVTGPRTDVADVTTYTYDAQGNLATVKNAAGHFTTLSNYDANGRVGRIVDANGLTTDLQYSPRGWLTSKNVGGEITGYEYDGVGQLKKVTQPDGSTITYTYDDAHRLTGIADSLGNSITYTLDPMGNRVKEQVKDPGGMLARQTTRVYDALNRLQQITGGM